MKGKIEPLQSVVLKVMSMSGKQISGSFKWTDPDGVSRDYYAAPKSLKMKHTNEGNNEVTIIIGFSDIRYADISALGKNKIVVVEFGYIGITRFINNMVVISRKLSMSSGGYNLTLTLVDKAFFQDTMTPDSPGKSVLEVVQHLIKAGSDFRVRTNGVDLFDEGGSVRYDPYAYGGKGGYIMGKTASLDYQMQQSGTGEGQYQTGGDRLSHTSQVQYLSTVLWGVDLDGDGEVKLKKQIPNGEYPSGTWASKEAYEESLPKTPLMLACTDQNLLTLAADGYFDFKDLYRHQVDSNPFVTGRGAIARKPENPIYDENAKSFIQYTDAVVGKDEVKINNGFNLSLTAADLDEFRTIKPSYKILNEQGFYHQGAGYANITTEVGYKDMEPKTMPDGTIVYPVTTHGKTGSIVYHAIDAITGIIFPGMEGTLTDYEKTEWVEGDKLFVPLTKDRNFSTIITGALIKKVDQFSSTSGSESDKAFKGGDNENYGNKLAAKQFVAAKLRVLFTNQPHTADQNSSAMQQAKNMIGNDPSDYKLSIDGNVITLHNDQPLANQFISRVYTLDPADEENSRIISVEASTDGLIAKMKEFNIQKTDEETKEINDLKAKITALQKNEIEDKERRERNLIELTTEKIVEIGNEILDQDARDYLEWIASEYNLALKEDRDFVVPLGKNFKVKLTKAQLQELASRGFDLRGEGKLAKYNEDTEMFEFEISANYFINNSYTLSLIEDKIKRQTAKVEKARNKLTLKILGDPKIGPGQTIILKNVSKAYSHSWLVQTASHDVDMTSGFTTTLECTLPAVSLNYSKYLSNKRIKDNKIWDQNPGTSNTVEFLAGAIKKGQVLVDQSSLSEMYSVITNATFDNASGGLEFPIPAGDVRSPVQAPAMASDNAAVGQIAGDTDVNPNKDIQIIVTGNNDIARQALKDKSSQNENN